MELKLILDIKDNYNYKYFSTGMVLADTYLVMGCLINPILLSFKINDNFGQKKELINTKEKVLSLL